MGIAEQVEQIVVITEGIYRIGGMVVIVVVSKGTELLKE